MPDLPGKRLGPYQILAVLVRVFSRAVWRHVKQGWVIVFQLLPLRKQFRAVQQTARMRDGPQPLDFMALKWTQPLEPRRSAPRFQKLLRRMNIQP